MSWLARLAAGAPAPVYPVIGEGAQPRVERLFASAALERARSPRAAALLLVSGDIPEAQREALDRVHDQVPRPRLSLRWDGDDGIEERLLDAWRTLCAGATGDADRLPDEPPNPWEGEGDFGQGGEGMMGGVPYGRPMAMTGEDVRDGLELDRYTARVGPFAPMLPPGLVLEVTLQGDVIVACEVLSPPYAQPEDADDPALCAARMLRLLGLPGPADRLIRGGAAHAIGARSAIPRGLGRLENAGDARKRFADALCGRNGGAADGIFDTLIGLEWSEAALALASVTPSALRQAALEVA